VRRIKTLDTVGGCATKHDSTVLVPETICPCPCCLWCDFVRFVSRQALAETDDQAASQLQQTNVQIKAVSQRIRNFDEQRSVELAEEEEAQTRGRRQLCYFAVLVAVGLVALAIWALTSQ